MFKDNKLLIAIMLILGVMVVVWYNTKENFWNIPSRTWKVEKVLQSSNPDVQAGGGPDFFQSPNFQSLLSPRFSNVNYGPNLRTQFPSYNDMGVSQDPLYQHEGGYRTGTSYKIPIDPHNAASAAYTNGNYDKVVSNIVKLGGSAPAVSEFAEGGENPSFLNANGEMTQPIVYDRYLYANRKSRLRALGDPIRGDLPIVPNTGNWFTPSVQVNRDLMEGALNTMAGVNNETNKQLANLIYNASGGGNTTIGGVDMASVNMANQYQSGLSAGYGDVQITSFP